LIFCSNSSFAAVFVLQAQLVQDFVWPVVTYTTKAWTFNKRLLVTLRHLQCYQKSLKIRNMGHITNEEVLDKIGQEVYFIKSSLAD